MTRWANENRYDPIIAAEAARTGVPVALIKAIISLESEFVAGAYRNEAPRSSLPPTPDFPNGGDRSIGLMQLLVRTARTLGYSGPIGDRSTLSGLYDPATNIHLGTILLRDNVAEAKRRGLGIDAAISAYNGGWRPSLGYGGRLANGQYANQGYVNVVAERMEYFGAPAEETPLKPVTVAQLPELPPLPGVELTPETPQAIAPIPTSPLTPIMDSGGTLPVLAWLVAAASALWVALNLFGDE